MSNMFDQFDSAGTSSASSVNMFDQFDGAPVSAPAQAGADPVLAAQWASSGPLERLKMMGNHFLPIAGNVIPPIAKADAAQAINIAGPAVGTTVGGMVGGIPGAMAGAGLGTYGAGRLNQSLGIGAPATMGQIAGNTLTAGGAGPISAPAMALAGGAAQSFMDSGKAPSPAQLAIMGIGAEMAAGSPESPTGSQVTRDATIKEGQAAGYVLPPNEINPSLQNNVLGSVAGKADLKAASKIRNQQATNTLAAQALGLDPAQPITAQAIQGVKDAANQAYAQVAALSPDAAGALEQLKQSRSDAKLYYRAYAASPADPSLLKKAQQAAQDGDIYEQLLEDQARSSGQPALVNNLRQARVTLAKANVVDTALNESSGNISAPTIGRLYDKGMPLTGELGTIGRFQQAFPLYTGEAESTAMPGVSHLSPYGALAGAIAGHEYLGAPGAIGGAVVPFTRPAVREAMLSGPYQAMFGRPSYGPPPPGLAANLARFTAQQGALTPNMSLINQQPTQ